MTAIKWLFSYLEENSSDMVSNYLAFIVFLLTLIYAHIFKHFLPLRIKVVSKKKDRVHIISNISSNSLTNDNTL